MKSPRVPAPGLAAAIVLCPLFCGAQTPPPSAAPAEKTAQELAVTTKATENKAPGWTKGGAFVHRLWPDTWSGQKKIYFFSRDGTARAWKLPPDWASVQKATLYPLTPDGRGAGVPLAITDRSLSPKLLPQIPYVLVPQAP